MIDDGWMMHDVLSLSRLVSARLTESFTLHVTSHVRNAYACAHTHTQHTRRAPVLLFFSLTVPPALAAAFFAALVPAAHIAVENTHRTERGCALVSDRCELKLRKFVIGQQGVATAAIAAAC